MTDGYTKFVLNIIAAALVYLCLSTPYSSVRAEGPIPVVITGVSVNGAEILPVGIAGTNFVRDLSVAGVTSGHWEYKPLLVKP